MRAGDPIRELARIIAAAPAKVEPVLQAQVQAQAQTIEASAQGETAVLSTFGDGASVTGDLSQTDVGNEADTLADAAANIGAQKILGL